MDYRVDVNDNTHVFMAKDGVVETSTTRARPEGITRAAVIELCEKNKIPRVAAVPQERSFAFEKRPCEFGKK